MRRYTLSSRPRRRERETMIKVFVVYEEAPDPAA